MREKRTGIYPPFKLLALDFPFLPESRVWRLFGISMDDAANARKPEGVRGYHNLVIVNRQAFLTNFILRQSQYIGTRILFIHTDNNCWWENRWR